MSLTRREKKKTSSNTNKGLQNLFQAWEPKGYSELSTFAEKISSASRAWERVEILKQELLTQTIHQVLPVIQETRLQQLWV